MVDLKIMLEFNLNICMLLLSCNVWKSYCRKMPVLYRMHGLVVEKRASRERRQQYELLKFIKKCISVN